MTCFVTKAMPIGYIDSKCHIKRLKSTKTCLIGYSLHIMQLVIHGLGGGHTHIRTEMILRYQGHAWFKIFLDITPIYIVFLSDLACLNISFISDNACIPSWRRTEILSFHVYINLYNTKNEMHIPISVVETFFIRCKKLKAWGIDWVSTEEWTPSHSWSWHLPN